MARKWSSMVAALIAALPGCSRFFQNEVEGSEEMKARSIHGLEFQTLEGERKTFQEYAGKAVLIVNVASECGLTPQYTGLERLHRELGPEGLVVIGFPSNEFGGQEPGGPEQIREFCTTNYDVTFPLAAKVETKAGPRQSPLYHHLGGATGKLPAWNFAKYLVGRDGRVIAFFDSRTPPDDPALRAAIAKALAS